MILNLDALTWKERYINHIIKVAHIEQAFAEATYEAGIPHDQTEDPEDAADIEMSYWDNDGDYHG
ncbi:MAG TPA: hypothetical protein VE977_13865 [Pyrinomonadaceae bacterium]|nr:hypothetical protein [Pyrinomonadaceae bacterium]